jgi:hypothetical protein
MEKSNAPPHLESFTEINSKLADILDWAADRVDDHVYYFHCPENLSGRFDHLQSLNYVNACIAGSGVLPHIFDLLFTTSTLKWKPTDVDIFFLAQKETNRLSLGSVDIVQSTETSVVSLLLHFDMPICRVAIDFTYGIWISAQCIYALYTKRQNMPKYLKERYSFLDTLNKHLVEPLDDENEPRKSHEYLYTRFADRIKKYQERGFGVNWKETDQILPWVRKRFNYAEWTYQ